MAQPWPKIATGTTRSAGTTRLFGPLETGEGTAARRSGAPALLLCLLGASFAPATAAERTCERWQAEVISVEGAVDIRSADGWTPIASGATLCTGDSLRVKRFSRAAIRLPDKTVLRLDEHTSMTFSEPEDDTGSWLDLLRGVIHVISRDPRALRFNTPYANAGLEGTEFVIEVDGSETDVTVLEGEVLLSNSAGSVGVPSGQRGTAGRAGTPVARPVPDALEAIDWTPYYVPLVDGPLPDAEQAPSPAEASSAEFFTRRAARRISVGKTADARADIERALALDAGYGDAYALQALIALSERNIERAAGLAARATESSPRAPAGWLATSYAAEARRELSEALSAAEAAVEAAPRHAFARARLGELRLATGDHDGARAAAETAAKLRGDLAHAVTVLGFAELGGSSSERAEARFREAVALEPAAPLPRLGLGLALTRQGNLEAGREQLEIAVVLDPTNALSRSYMARVYEAERREPLSATQLELAKTLGPRDPTAWYYDALRKQNDNRPVEALQDLQTAIALNDSRSVYRSSLQIDEDLAARSAGVGQLHRTLGFEQLALLEGWKSVTSDPADHSGHRLLADVYSHLPRHQIARVDELYQSQILQPLNVTPVRPQLAEANLFILDTLGPSALAFDEFQRPVQDNGLRFSGSAAAAGNGTRGADIAVAGLHDRLSYSVGHFDFSTDGFRDNNDLNQTVTNALIQARLDAETTLTGELRSSAATKGDLSMMFDPNTFNATLRQDETVNSLRLGLKRSLGKGTLAASVSAETVDASVKTSESFSILSERRGSTADAQYHLGGDKWQLTAGARHFNHRHTDALAVASPIQAGPHGVSHFDVEYESGYIYGRRAFGNRLTGILGGSIDRLQGQIVDREQLNPKAGLIWETTKATTVRAVVFRTLQSPFVSKHNIVPSLEPTQVAGFNQRYFSAEGEDAWHYGAAIDHRFFSDFHAGLLVSLRDRTVPISLERRGKVDLRSVDAQETLGRAYAYWTPTPNTSVSATYQYEQFDNGGVVLSDGASKISTHRVPLQLNWFHPSGFSAGITATYVDQAGDFNPRGFGPDAPTRRGEDSFWVADLSAGYRLPSRRGRISLNIHNALDQSFRFQDTDPENPRILPERMALLRFTLSY